MSLLDDDEAAQQLIKLSAHRSAHWSPWGKTKKALLVVFATSIVKFFELLLVGLGTVVAPQMDCAGEATTAAAQKQTFGISCLWNVWAVGGCFGCAPHLMEG